MIIPREAVLSHNTPHWWVIASSPHRWSTMEHRNSKVTIIRRRNRAWLSFISIWRKKSLFSSRRLLINRWKCVNNGANRWTFFFRSSASPWIWLIYGVFRIYATRTAEVRFGPEPCFSSTDWHGDLFRCLSDSIRPLCYSRWNATLLFGTSPRTVLPAGSDYLLEKDLSSPRRDRLGSDSHRLLHGFLLQCRDLVGSLLSLCFVPEDLAMECMQYVEIEDMHGDEKLSQIPFRSSMELEGLFHRW